ncbi:MAG TPA: A24 family peptidase [Acidimicrobiia bacterium]|nr:A24 family peptidase [Acidimicrobiia bacterium]
MTTIIAGALGFLGALIAHDLATQVLRDQPLRPLSGTCPGCGTRRGWLSFRCEACGRNAGRELLLVLLGTAAAAGFANTLGPEWALIPYLGFLWLTMALGITDIDAFRIVDRLNIRGTVALIFALGAASLADGVPGNWVRGLLGGLAYFAGTNLVFLLVRGRGFGYGDVKLSAILGVFTAYISWGTLGWSVFLTALIGGLISIGVLGAGWVVGARRRRDGQDDTSIREIMKTEVPYGPAMILGAWLGIVLAGLGAFPLPT